MISLKLVLRSIFRRPGYASVVILTLALGLGMMSLVIGVTDAIVYRPLGAHTDQLVALGELEVSTAERRAVSPLFLQELALRSDVIEEFATYSAGSNVTLVGDTAQRLVGWSVSPNLFSLLGIAPLHGQGFSRNADGSLKDSEVMLSYGLWQRQFGGDRSMVGQSIQFGERQRTVVGVMPPEFQFPRKGWLCEFWLPEVELDKAHRSFQPGSNRNWEVIGRLSPGVTAKQVKSALDSAAANLARQFPESNAGWGTWVEPASVLFSDPFVRRSIGILGAMAGLILLIVCANVANLLLLRTGTRGRELGVRLALGAGRGALAKLILLEALVLALLGTGLGLFIVSWGNSLMQVFAPIDLPQVRQLAVDGTVVALAAGLAVLVALGSAAGPMIVAVLMARYPSVTKGTGPATSWRHSSLLLRGFAVVEVATAIALTTGAVLMLRTLSEIEGVRAGFQAKQLHRFGAYAPMRSQNDLPSSVQRQRDFAKVISGFSGTEALGVMTGTRRIQIAGQGDTSARVEVEEVRCEVGDQDLLKTLGVELVAGRLLSRDDAATGSPAVVIDEGTARLLWPNELAVGKTLHARAETYDPSGGQGESLGAWQVVGVVRRLHWSLFEGEFEAEPKPLVYRAAGGPLASHFWYFLRSQLPVNQLQKQVAQQIAASNDLRPTRPVENLVALHASSELRRRAFTGLLTICALVGVMLSALGLFGVMSYWTTNRTREFGIRMALGAAVREIVLLVMRQGVVTVALGCCFGGVAALSVSRLLHVLLYGVSPYDWTTLGFAMCLLFAVGAVACFIPAWWAARTEPSEALRTEA